MARKRKKPLADILFEIYQELYRQSTPSADFMELYENAEKDEHGRKVIHYEDYFIDSEVYDKIVETIMGQYQLTKPQKQSLKLEAYLGFGPTSLIKNNTVNENS